jgi:hypothetical protein
MAGVSERAVDHIETMNGPEILGSVDQIEKLDKVARRTFGLDDNPLPSGFSLNVLNLGSLGVEIRHKENPQVLDLLPSQSFAISRSNRTRSGRSLNPGKTNALMNKLDNYNMGLTVPGHWPVRKRKQICITIK